MLKGFRNFLIRGNVVDLAVAVVMGGAFGSIVNALVKDIITPLIGLVGGEPDFSRFQIRVYSTNFMIGDFLNAVISFVIISAVVYFFIVAPMNKIMEKIKKGEKVDPLERQCPECLSMIPVKAKRCKYCTAVVAK